MNIALFGFMGVGKTVLGELLAEELGFTFVDIDDEIEKKVGKPIETIFEEDGEVVFRKIEKKVTKHVSSRDNLIIACGGGTVLDKENLRRLKNNSKMILLTADPETILKRVEAEGETRPLLKSGDRLDRINTLLHERFPHYLKAADLIIETSGKTPSQIVDEISRRLGELSL